MERAFVITIIAVAAILIHPAENVWAHPPWGIVVDRQGQVYVSDLETIWKIDAQGKQKVFRPGVSGRHIHELTIDEAGNLFGEDLTYEPSTQRYTSAIWKMTPAGGFSYVLAPTQNAPKGMSIWRDRDGNTHYLQKDNPKNEIVLLKRSPNGKITVLIGSRDAAERERQLVLYSMGGMEFAEDGALYLTDGESIYKVTTSGVVTTLIRRIPAENSSGTKAGENSTTRLLGLTVDNQGNIFAADLGNRRVLKIASNGNVSTLLHGEETWTPTGVAFKNGELYILESRSASPATRVRKQASDGRVTVFATIGENISQPTRENPPGESIGTFAIGRQNPPYVLIVVCASAFALIFVIWRVRKRKLNS